jgi:ADP-ribosylglycohydrolase
MAFLRSFPRTLLRAVVQSSRTTHANAEAVDGCLYFSGLLVGALLGGTKEAILSPRWFPIEGVWEHVLLVPSIDAVAAGSYKGKPPGEVRSGGYVVETLEAALWGFHGTDSFREGALKVVNLGHDADTTGAVFGQIAGACYGLSGIPAEWVERITDREGIVSLADRLFTLSGVEEAVGRSRTVNVHCFRTWDSGGCGAASFGEMRRYRAEGIDRVLAVRHDGRGDWAEPVRIRKWERG